MDRREKREQALIIWMEKINLIPTEVQVDCALWGCQREMREVKEIQNLIPRSQLEYCEFCGP